MARATHDNTTLRWRDCIFEAVAIAVILISGGVASCLIASNLEGKIAHHCAKGDGR
jgi:hypothetical protein